MLFLHTYSRNQRGMSIFSGCDFFSTQHKTVPHLLPKTPCPAAMVRLSKCKTMMADQVSIPRKKILPSLCSLQALCQAPQIFLLPRLLHWPGPLFSTLSMCCSLPTPFSNFSCPSLPVKKER